MTIKCKTCPRELDPKEFEHSGWLLIPTVGDSDPLLICPHCQEK